MDYHWHKRIGFVTLAALAMATAGCGGGGGGVSLGPAPAIAQGVVVDEGTGQPISGATARSGSRSARTASDGTFTLGVEVGIVSVTVSKSNYHSGSLTANPSAGETVNLGTITLTDSENVPPPPPL